jgi:hypothetical protein
MSKLIALTPFCASPSISDGGHGNRLATGARPDRLDRQRQVVKEPVDPPDAVVCNHARR